MLNTQGEIKFSEHVVLYDMLIPADNKYRLIDELIDFSFIYDDLQREVNENMTTIKTIIKPTGIGGVKESVPYARCAKNALAHLPERVLTYALSPMNIKSKWPFKTHQSSSCYQKKDIR